MKKALILVDHGSKFPEANDQLTTITDLVRKKAHQFDIVLHAHMELAHPTIEEAFRECAKQGAKLITVHPFFLAPGRHSTTDIPRLVSEAASKHDGVAYVVGDALGIHEKLVDVALERADEALKTIEKII